MPNDAATASALTPQTSWRQQTFGTNLERRKEGGVTLFVRVSTRCSNLRWRHVHRVCFRFHHTALRGFNMLLDPKWRYVVRVGFNTLLDLRWHYVVRVCFRFQHTALSKVALCCSCWFQHVARPKVALCCSRGFQHAVRPKVALFCSHMFWVSTQLLDPRWHYFVRICFGFQPNC